MRSRQHTLGSLEHAVRRGREIARAGVADPSWFAHRVVDYASSLRDSRHDHPYAVDDDWEPRLHEWLRVGWPCQATDPFRSVFQDAMDLLVSQGLQVGRGAFGGWGDGEPAFTRASWCIACHSRPARVVETGVARGVTTRTILEAFRKNGAGHLWSIDLPPPSKPELLDQVGAAVPASFRGPWTYVRGASSTHLRPLLAELGEIDLFVHDSSHTSRNVRFELDAAWNHLRPGGYLLVDDIDYSDGFKAFTARAHGAEWLVGRGEPLRPDRSRRDHAGLFGVVRKQEAAGASRAA